MVSDCSLRNPARMSAFWPRDPSSIFHNPVMAMTVAAYDYLSCQ